MKKNLLLHTIIIFLLSAMSPQQSFQSAVKTFTRQYRDLDIPAFTFEYKDYLLNIPPAASLKNQRTFFEAQQKIFAQLSRNKLSKQERLTLAQVNYEIAFGLQRLSLEEEWLKGDRSVPANGLSKLPNYKSWYSYFVKKYTSLDWSPEQVMEFGKKEVARVQKEIQKIQQQLKLKDSAAFYAHLKDKSFYLTTREDVLRYFEKIDSTARQHLASFTGTTTVPEITAMEWPNAGANTPPGIYLNHRDNPYGKDVFQFNFYGQAFNKRAAEWLYMHEAIPGHHLQFSFNQDTTGLDDLFMYPGNFEGWACYVEYFGKELGLYKDPYSYLGKWEWDLVRSVRIVLDAGIQYYGWSHDEALSYWKQNIAGQDEIAEREITRVTNWAAQALSYKLGAEYIFKLKEDWNTKNNQQQSYTFHQLFLQAGKMPLPVVREVLLGNT